MNGISVLSVTNASLNIKENSERDTTASDFTFLSIHFGNTGTIRESWMRSRNQKS